MTPREFVYLEQRLYQLRQENITAADELRCALRALDKTCRELRTLIEQPARNDPEA